MLLLSCTSVIFACHADKRSHRNTAVGQHVSNGPICIVNKRMLFKRCYKLMRFSQHSSTCIATRREVRQSVRRPQEEVPWMEPLQITLRLLLSSCSVIRYISVHSCSHSLRMGSANLTSDKRFVLVAYAVGGQRECGRQQSCMQQLASGCRDSDRLFSLPTSLCV